MAALDLKQNRLIIWQLVKLDPVNALTDILVFDFARNLKLQNESLDECHDLVHLDGGSVDEAFCFVVLFLVEMGSGKVRGRSAQIIGEWSLWVVFLQHVI